MFGTRGLYPPADAFRRFGRHGVQIGERRAGEFLRYALSCISWLVRRYAGRSPGHGPAASVPLPGVAGPPGPFFQRLSGGKVIAFFPPRRPAGAFPRRLHRGPYPRGSLSRRRRRPVPQVQAARRPRPGPGARRGSLRHPGPGVEQPGDADPAHGGQPDLPLDRLPDQRRREAQPRPRLRVRGQGGDHPGLPGGPLGGGVALPLPGARRAERGGPVADRADPRRAPQRDQGDRPPAHPPGLPRRPARAARQALRLRSLADAVGGARQDARVQRGKFGAEKSGQG